MDGWRNIPGYGGMYQIDITGEVRSWRGRHGRLKRPRRLTPFVRKQGQKSRCLWVKLTSPNGSAKDVKVQSLMRDVWMAGELPGVVVYHKNGDLTDNTLHNLGYITTRDLGRLTGAQSRRRPIARVDRDGNKVAFYPSARAAAKANHMSYQAVLDRCAGKVKQPFALDGHSFVFDEEDQP